MFIDFSASLTDEDAEALEMDLGSIADDWKSGRLRRPVGRWRPIGPISEEKARKVFSYIWGGDPWDGARLRGH
jgi:hypothetical protein